MGLIERVRILLETAYAAYRNVLRPQRDADVADRPLKREEIEERERQRALRELDRLRNQRPER